MDQETIDQIKHFHGHMCPGLAIGIRAAEIALDKIGRHATDEEVVAVVETDMCAVDAIQYMTGCTFGKGNLIHRDYGKNAFTFIRRSDDKALRVVTKPQAWGDTDAEHQSLFAKVRAGEANVDEKKRFQELHLARSKAVLECPTERLFDVTEFDARVPKKARIHTSEKCEECGEHAMETRIRKFGGKSVCVPCFEKLEAR